MQNLVSSSVIVVKQRKPNRFCSKCGTKTVLLVLQKKKNRYTYRWYSDKQGGNLCPHCWKEGRRISTLNYRDIKKQVFTHYFGPDFCCDDCGIKDIRVLELDHPEGGGNKQRREFFNGRYVVGMHFYAYLKRKGYPDVKVRPRCANCHTIAGYERIEVKYQSK